MNFSHILYINKNELTLKINKNDECTRNLAPSTVQGAVKAYQL